MLERLGRFCARHRWWVVGSWLVIIVGVSVAASSLGVKTIDDFSIPGTDSQAALDLLKQDFPSAAGASASVIYAAPKGHELDEYSKSIDATVTELEKLPDVATVGNPTTLAVLVGKDQIAQSPVQFKDSVTDIPDDTFALMEKAAKPARDAGLNVQLGGGVVDAQNIPQSALSDHADEIGLAIAVVILVIAFGSLLHMALPIGSAVFGISLLTSVIVLLEHQFTISTVAPILGTMIGLGVGIDYSLFIVTRFRAELAGGLDVEDAVGRALGTAGRAVLFAGATVCISTTALTLVGIPIVATMGLVAALFVAVMVTVSVTLLPALMGLAGHRIETWRVPGLAGRAPEPLDPERPRGFARLAVFVADHAWAFAIGTFALLLVLAFPVLRMEVGFTDDGDAPLDTTQRQAYDLMTKGFGAGVNGPLLVVAETTPKTTPASLTALGKALSDDTAIAAAIGPEESKSKQAALFLVTPKSGPASPETTDLVNRLRADTIPKALEGTDLDAAHVHVGGPTAISIDLTELVAKRLPIFIGAVLAGSFLLLLVVFHSLLVPLKAVIMNLLSIGAAYGIVVAVFQWGWLKDVVGLDQTIEIWAFVPLMMFAILFGLSMDYEVFLMTRMQEEYADTSDARRSVITGVGETARVISSAAMVMIAVFLSFVTNPSAIVKMIGLGLAAAVFVDATFVRILLVPAVMDLLGPRAWWLPRWLDKILPKVHIEG